jgi:hypothetical protein
LILSSSSVAAVARRVAVAELADLQVEVVRVVADAGGHVDARLAVDDAVAAGRVLVHRRVREDGVVDIQRRHLARQG